MSRAPATAESRKELAADDLVRVAGLAADALGGRSEEAWSARAGSLEWDCWETVEHAANAQYFYGSQLARREPAKATRILAMKGSLPEHPNTAVRANRDEGPTGLLELMEAHASLLAAVVRDRPAQLRTFHPLGITDPEGCAAMGLVEVLAHTHDAAAGLGVEWNPPADVCTRVLDRLFPDVRPEAGGEPWPALLWATGRADLPGRERRTAWMWDNSPRSERS